MFYSYNKAVCQYLSENYPDPDSENLLAKKDRIIPRYPCTTIYTEPSFNYVMIKTTAKMMNERGGSLYASTRRFWKAGERISEYSYVVSVVDQVVQRVYIADTWFRFSDGRWAERWGLILLNCRSDQSIFLLLKTLTISRFLTVAKIRTTFHNWFKMS